jgi:hypothetical protein
VYKGGHRAAAPSRFRTLTFGRRHSCSKAMRYGRREILRTTALKVFQREVHTTMRAALPRWYRPSLLTAALMVLVGSGSTEPRGRAPRATRPGNRLKS